MDISGNYNRGTGRGIKSLNIGWYSRNCGIGCVIGLMDISLAYTLFMRSLICAGSRCLGGNTSVTGGFVRGRYCLRLSLDSEQALESGRNDRSRIRSYQV